MNNSFPIWLLGIDYLLACVMIILLIKFIFNLFLSENCNFIFFLFINKLVHPIINITNKFTPGFIVPPIIPLYLAWIVFMIRLYILPLFLGHSYIGKFAFTFEKYFFTEIKSIFLNVALNLNYGI